MRLIMSVLDLLLERSVYLKYYLILEMLDLVLIKTYCRCIVPLMDYLAPLHAFSVKPVKQLESFCLIYAVLCCGKVNG